MIPVTLEAETALTIPSSSVRKVLIIQTLTEALYVTFGDDEVPSDTNGLYWPAGTAMLILEGEAAKAACNLWAASGTTVNVNPIP